MLRLLRFAFAGVPAVLLYALPLAAQAAEEGDVPRLVVGQPVQGVIEDGARVVETETLATRYAKAPTVGQVFRFELDEPGPITIELRSYAFDAYLVLRDAERNVLGEDDDGLIGTHSRLVSPDLEAEETYLLEACALHGQRGPFELVLKRGEPPVLSSADRAALELDDAARRVEALEDLEGPESQRLAAALDSLGLLHYRRGAYEQARPLWARALAIRERTFGPEHPDTARSLKNLAELLRSQGDYAAARPLQERALAIREKVLGPEHPDTASSMGGLALVFFGQGDYAAARSLLERALAIREKVYGPGHSETVNQLSSLAGVLDAQGDYSGARLLLERALVIRERDHGPNHPETAHALNNLAAVLDSAGDYARARPLFERALAIREERLGPEHPEIAVVLDNLSSLLLRQGDYAAALPLSERALAITESVHGPEHLETAYALNGLAELLVSLADFAAARPLYERALAIREAVLGAEHPDTASSLALLAKLLRDQGDLAGARPLQERALAIREAVLGPEHSLTARSLLNLSSLLADQGDLAGARRLAERGLEIVETAQGPEHPDVAGALNNLATLLMMQSEYAAARVRLERGLRVCEAAFGPEHRHTDTLRSNLASLMSLQGDYAGARRLFERALALSERNLGPDHPDTAGDLSNLAALMGMQGDYAGALPLHERALAISEKSLGPEHPHTASALRDLAQALMDQRELAAARPLFERALAIRERVLGPDHLGTAESLNELAVLLAIQGDDAGARRLLERALSINEEVLGPEHPDTALNLGNLGALLGSMDDYAGARPILERALAVNERVLGPDHPDTAGSLISLAEILRLQGDHAGAEPLFERALAINEAALGSEHPETAHANRKLARLRETQGDYAAARSLYERSLMSYERAFGPSHSTTAVVRNDLAMLLADLGEPRAAWSLVHRAQIERQDRIESTLASMSEGERYAYLAGLRWQLELLLSIARESDEPAVRVEAYDTLLGWKGRVGRLLAASRAQLVSRMGAEERSLVEELRRAQAQLSRLALETEILDREMHDRRSAELRAERGRLERELQRLAQSPDESASAGFEELRSAVEPGSALIDFFAHRVYRPGDGELGGWDEERVTAWITRAGHEAPTEVDLGPVENIDAALQSFLEELVIRRGFTSIGGEGSGEGNAAGARLRELLWAPIAPHLDGVRTVFVSPDGALGTLPFEALPLEGDVLAIERYRFVYLPDARELARPEPTEARGAAFDSLLSVGAVDFRKRADWEGTEPSAGEATSTLRGSFTDYWGRLPATEYESQVVADMHEDAFDEDGRRLLLQGGEPSEERLKHELECHAVLHLATHGYFQPEGMPSMWEAARGGAGRTEMRMRAEAEQLVGKHPGLLSGLVCAGANRGGDDDGDDGYLTAEEVGWLDLSACELVVLSACETGLGRPQSGEGLIGLRRAFQTAGAKTVVSSLWSVKDESTAELMRDFYKNLFLKGMGRHEALRAAQLAMLQRNRMEHGEPLPSTWGAFVLSGEWR